MGNRSVITIKTEDNPLDTITLYGHYAGATNLIAVERVMKRTDRIGDISYLTSQLFYEFAVVLNKYDGGLGFGIWAGEADERDNPPVIVNADTGDYEYNGNTYNKDGEIINE